MLVPGRSSPTMRESDTACRFSTASPDLSSYHAADRISQRPRWAGERLTGATEGRRKVNYPKGDTLTSQREPRRPARAEVVGSLLRPPKLQRVLDDFYEGRHAAILEDERRKDRTHLRAVEDEAIAEAVARQIDVGLDVVTDGEFRRALFMNSFVDAVRGFVANPELLQFTGDDGSIVETPGVPMVAERLRKIDSPAAREVDYLKSITDYPFKVTFPCASIFLMQMPMMFKPGITDGAYSAPGELLEEIMAIERELIADAVAAGARYIQLDYPVYPHFVDERWTSLMREKGLDPDVVFEQAIAADIQIVEGIPDDVTVAMHICRGNYRSRWLARGSLEPLAERIFAELPYDVFLVEWEDVDRDGDYSPIRFVPEGRIMVLGLVSSKKPELESEDELMRRIDEAARHLDVAQLAISAQCGFASNRDGNEIDEETQWRKLELVARVADRVWPRG